MEQNKQSKLNQLLAELCPEGVEFEKLGELLDYEQPTKYIVKSTKYDHNYKTPVLTAGQSFILWYTNEDDWIFMANKENPAIIFDDFTTSFHWVDFDFKIKSSAMKILRWKWGNSYVKLRFIYYAMKCISFTPADHSRHWISKYSNFQIPIPPLPVQEEIVRILDKFTSLEAELEAELEARKCQYEFYRNQLLAFDKDEIVWKTLGEIATIQRGASPRPIQSYLTDQEDWIPWIKIGDTNVNSKYIYSTEQKITKEGAEKSRILKKWDFILSNSMSFGRPYILQIDGAIHDGWASISNFDKYLNADFLYYYLSSSIVQNYRNTKINTSSVSNLNSEIIKSLQIPLPPLEQQEAIVYILDHFDQLANDLTAGLPAELHLRQQQYAYYRDMLLNFSSELVSEREREH